MKEVYLVEINDHRRMFSTYDAALESCIATNGLRLAISKIDPTYTHVALVKGNAGITRFLVYEESQVIC